jgi:hypothetical protein
MRTTMRPVVPLMLLLALTSGCAAPLLLKKYAATSPKVPTLKGRSVYVMPFRDERQNEWNESEPLPDPPRWAPVEVSSEQFDRWDLERRKRGEGLPISSQYQVGHKRNAFGMPIAEVFSSSSPAEWLTDATRLELAAQGAIAALSPEAADVVVQGVVRHVWLDLYMLTWVHVVVDLTTTAPGHPPKSVRLHVADSRMAWSGGDSESYEVFCAAEQKLQWYLLNEVARSAAQLSLEAPAL